MIGMNKTGRCEISPVRLGIRIQEDYSRCMYICSDSTLDLGGVCLVGAGLICLLYIGM